MHNVFKKVWQTNILLRSTVPLSQCSENRFFRTNVDRITYPFNTDSDLSTTLMLNKLQQEIKPLLKGKYPSELGGIIVQHFLPSTPPLLEKLVRHISPGCCITMDKNYSTVPSSFGKIEKLRLRIVPSTPSKTIGDYQQKTQIQIKLIWKELEKLDLQHKIKRLIVLDEGGRCNGSIPELVLDEKEIVAIEQTRGGLYHPGISSQPFPIINVAQSAIKMEFESSLVIDSVLSKLHQYLEKKNSSTKRFGIIGGNGAIGRAIVSTLINANQEVYITDPATKKAFPKSYYLASVGELFRKANVVMGCTGLSNVIKDIKLNTLLEDCTEDLDIMSWSSEDKEFKPLLLQVRQLLNGNIINPLDNLILKTKSNHKITIHAGGFPINFDRTPASDPPEFALTRMLLYAAWVQAMLMHEVGQAKLLQQCTTNQIMLDPILQYYVLAIWSHIFAPNLIATKFGTAENCIDWIKTDSIGNHIRNEKIEAIWSNQMPLNSKLVF